MAQRLQPHLQRLEMRPKDLLAVFLGGFFNVRGLPSDDSGTLPISHRDGKHLPNR